MQHFHLFFIFKFTLNYLKKKIACIEYIHNELHKTHFTPFYKHLTITKKIIGKNPIPELLKCVSCGHELLTVVDLIKVIYNTKYFEYTMIVKLNYNNL